MTVTTIAANGLRRLVRERGNIFFVFVLPLALILVIGLQFGGTADVRLVVGGEPSNVTDGILERVAEGDGIAVDRIGTADDVRDAVERGRAHGGLAIPAGVDERIAGGGSVALPFVARPDLSAQAIRVALQRAIAQEGGAIGAVRLLEEEGVAEGDEARRRYDDAERAAPGVEVRRTHVGEPDELAEEFDGLGRFDLGAGQQLFLFVFLTTLAGASSLIQSRRLGVIRRTLAGPTTAERVIAGEALARFGVAMVQGLYIVIGSAVLFDVDWGDPIGFLALLAAFGVVSAAAAMLLGAVLDNDAQAGGIGVFLALGVGALGGSMLPIELFPETVARIAQLTPHAWGMAGHAELVRRDGGLVDVLPEIGVLLGAGVVLLAIAGHRLQVAITRG